MVPQAQDGSLSRTLVRIRAEMFALSPPPTPSAWWKEADLRRPEVIRWMETFRSEGKRGLQHWMEDAAPYAPHVRAILLEEGLPSELWVLTLLESGSRPDARSPSAAVGPWQVLPATARHNGLVLSEDRDERRDWEQSTRAACRYLLALRREVGGSLLAIAAFNCGPGRIQREVKRSGTKEFWALDLPRETERYVPRALALIQLVGAVGPEKISATSGEALAFEVVGLPHSVRVKDLARVAGSSEEALHRLNPGWLRPVTPGDGNPVQARVPAGAGSRVRAAIAEGTLATVTLAPDRVHRVAPGDTLWAISRRYQVRLNDLREVNGIEGDVLRPGQTLRIPGGSATP
jgi:membrane-bound lytic murein transglycosylase D